MPLKIDGSHGEGGGQILRTSLALSAVTGEAVEVHDVRAERETPGLKRQHLAVVDAIAEMSDADVEGDDEGSERVFFDPSEVTGGKYTVDVGTAGSVTLVAQSAILASVGADSTVELVIRGGTDVKWSPTYAYLEHVTLPLLGTIGVEAESRLVRRGHYPEGGGEISLVVEPSYPEPTRLTRRGELRRVEGLSQVTNLPDHIADRQADAARDTLDEEVETSDAEGTNPTDTGTDIETEVTHDDGVPSKGTSITLWASFENGAVLGGSAVGERGKPAEEVGEEAARDLIGSIESRATVDLYSGDQLVPYVALAGGEYVAPEATSHLETNVWVCGKFVENEVGTEPVDGGVEVISS